MGAFCKPLQPYQLSSPLAFLPAVSFGRLWVNLCSPTLHLGPGCAHEHSGCQSPFGEATQTCLQASYSSRCDGFSWRWNFSFAGEGASLLRTRKLLPHLGESLYESRPVLVSGWLRLSGEGFLVESIWHSPDRMPVHPVTASPPFRPRCCQPVCETEPRS